MSDVLLAVALAEVLGREDGVDWIEDLGDLTDLVGPSAEARFPGVDAVRAVVDQLGYPCEWERMDDGWRGSEQQLPDGEWPPIGEIEVRSAAITFDLGPIEGPLEILRRLATEFGPFIAMTGSSGAPALITPETTDDDALAMLDGEL